MSSDTDAAAAATVALFETLYTNSYCCAAASVLLIYDTFITFDREVACFWTAKRPGGASLLFFAIKWTSMTLYVMGLVTFTSFPSDKSCSLFHITMEAMLILQFVPGAVPVGANLVHYGYQFSGENFPPFGCLDTDNTTAALDLKYDLFSLITPHWY
ncbi:hypothetical protein C8T65DRAFT_754270 [Cerioporus squamosus]|nr:hypothetical protein C8T65DRAFT_754270 [Cerioporus squamosus]